MRNLMPLAALFTMVLLAGVAHGGQHQNTFAPIVEYHVKICKTHFDVLPYYLFALDPAKTGKMSEEFEESLASFIATGQLIIPEEKKNDPLILRCASVAKELLSIGLARLGDLVVGGSDSSLLSP